MSLLALRYLSVCPYSRYRQSLHGISWYLMLGGLTDICRYVLFLVNIRKTKHFYTKTWTRVCAHLEGDLLKAFIGTSNISSRNCTEEQSVCLQLCRLSAKYWDLLINPLNHELNPICYLLALLAHHFRHVSRIMVKSLTLRLLMSYIYIYIYIYGVHILDVSRSHTTTHHSR